MKRLLAGRGVRRLVFISLGEKGIAMIGKVWNGCRSFCGKVVAGVGAVVTAFSVGATDVFAAGTPVEVAFTPLVNFTGIFDTITPVIAGVVASALILGLGLWGSKYVFHIIRSMGR